jgi:hypothetical protein
MLSLSINREKKCGPKAHLLLIPITDECYAGRVKESIIKFMFYFNMLVQNPLLKEFWNLVFAFALSAYISAPNFSKREKI